MTTKSLMTGITLAVVAGLGLRLAAQVPTEVPPPVPGAQPVAVSIDATKVAPPITKLVFGGFMEPATTGVWAEMLADRKFFAEITSKPIPPTPTGGFGRRGPQRRWLPVGPDEFVTMDRQNAYVGEWSPLVRLEAATPHGIEPGRPRAARRPGLHGPRGAGGHARAPR